MIRSQQAHELAIELRHAIPGIEIYVFGSWSRNRDARDVDLLIIYREIEWADMDIRRVRHQIARTVERIVGLPADITALTVGEASQLNFIASEGCVALSDLVPEPFI